MLVHRNKLQVQNSGIKKNRPASKQLKELQSGFQPIFPVKSSFPFKVLNYLALSGAVFSRKILTEVNYYLPSSLKQESFGIKAKKVLVRWEEGYAFYSIEVEKFVNSVVQRAAQNPIDNKIASSQGASKSSASVTKGLGSGLASTYVKTSVYAELYDFLAINGLSPSVSGGAAGAFSTLAINPLKNWNTRIRTSDAKLTPTETLEHFPRCIQDALRGAPLGMVRDGAWAACYNSLLSTFLDKFVPEEVKSNPELSHVLNVLKLTLGTLSGALAAVITTPLAVILTVVVKEKVPAREALEKIRSREAPIGEKYGKAFGTAVEKGFHKVTKGTEPPFDFKLLGELRGKDIQNLLKASHWSALRMGVTGGLLTFILKNDSLIINSQYET